MKRKVILRCNLSPGDIVMLTAAVRDLCLAYPGEIEVDVRTLCPELFDNNPHLTPLDERDPAVELVECEYPLIERSNRAPHHALHGFVEFLNRTLGLDVRSTAFAGDIHLSPEERALPSEVARLAGEQVPFWIVAAGGKYDATIKWWDTERYQAVVDHFKGRLQFVQVGHPSHFHPRLNNVVDLRGKTGLRELVRLVYHAKGVLCPVTCLMHLAAAIEPAPGAGFKRSCIVLAGGREPLQWVAYPGHTVLHAGGTLPCCASGGCWRDRVAPLGDGDPRDEPESLCVDVVGELPRCMDQISAGDVIREVERCLSSGVATRLTVREAKAGKRAMDRTRENPLGDRPLTVGSVREETARYLERLPLRPGFSRERGVVICGGGRKYFPCVWVCVQMLRRLGCQLPIQLWHIGSGEMTPEMKALLDPLGVECVDAAVLEPGGPARQLGGYEVKAYALLRCPFREVLLLDADNVAIVDPSFLFSTDEYRETGAIFWPDYGRMPRESAIWSLCEVEYRDEPEFESGQIVVDKGRCWDALALADWYNQHSDFFYQYIHGDKDTFHMAFRRLNRRYAMPSTPVLSLEGVMCQHDFEGNRIFQHRNSHKWSITNGNRRVAGFQFEEDCLRHLDRLKALWRP